MAQMFPFGTPVIIDYGPKWYRARVLDFRVDEVGDPLYYVHYIGFKTSDDEWLIDHLVHENTKEFRDIMTAKNAQFKKDAQAKKSEPRASKAKKKKPAKKGKKASKATKKKENKTTTAAKRKPKSGKRPLVENGSDAPPPPSKSTKRQKTVKDDAQPVEEVIPAAELIEDCAEPAEELFASLDDIEQINDVDMEVENQVEELKLKVPASILEWIKTEETYIKTGLLVQLPSTHTVEAIIKLYLKQRKEKNDPEAFKISQLITKFVTDTFNNRFLELCYDAEEQQHEEVMNQFLNKKPSQIYGAIHLIRGILVMPPEDLVHFPLITKELELILDYIGQSFHTFIKDGDYV